MVFQKRLDYGSSGYQVPAMPRVPKSAKGKRSVRKKFQDNPMRAFELLATLAGKLLLEKEKSSSPADLNGTPNPTTLRNSVKQGQLDEEKPFKPEAFVQGSCDDSTLGVKNGLRRQATYASNELFQTPRAIASVPYSLIPKSDPSDRDAFAARSILHGSRDESKCPLSLIANKGNTDRHPPESAIYEGKANDGRNSALQDVRQKSAYLTEVRVPDKHASDDMREVVAKPPSFVSSDSSVEVPLCGDRTPHKSSFPKSRDDIELDVDRDDDENSSGCTHPSTITPKHIRPKFINDHKMRRLLTSTYWKVAPRLLKDGEVSNNVSDVGTQAGFNNKRMGYTRQRTHRSLFKRRKVFERYSMSASDSGMGSKGIYSPPIRNGSEIELNELRETAHGVYGASTSMADKRSSYELDNFHVKLSIKSFKVPELYIEMPETATVGALKRTVMEAVTAILEGGLRVGVLLQGKKVRDDSKTLRQAGISHNHKMDNLGFSLEPNSSQALQPFTSSEDPCSVAPHNSSGPLMRIPAAAPVSEAEPSTPILEPPLTSMVNSPESGYDSVHSTTNISFPDKTPVNSQALVAVPPMNLEPMAVVPLHKSKRSELVQRRIRRPFSVSEVEALVQAVEKLGTGRWRDVKLRAFDNAKHRTYVDLKDKWKTLVHTAKISPQQRRGEPVPQELLDRVLLAHAYWSQQQAKLQVKPQQAQACLLF